MNKVLAIIPAYNEEKSIKKVINDIYNMAENIDVVVVNDGSTDNTGKEAKNTKAYVISLPYNLGIGGAMQTGYMYALKKGYHIALQVDADGQHDVKNIKNIIKPLIDEEADLVIGSRYLEKTEYRSTFFRRLGMIYFTNIIKLFTREKITDTTSGFRAVNKKIIELFADDYPQDYPEVEVLVRLNKKKFKIKEVSVEMHERKTGKSSITVLKSVYYMTKVTLGILISAIKN